MTPVEASTGSASTTRTFRFGLVPFAALAFSIGLVLGNISLAWAQSDDVSGDAASAPSAADQPGQNGASNSEKALPESARSWRSRAVCGELLISPESAIRHTQVSDKEFVAISRRHFGRSACLGPGIGRAN